MAEYQLSYTASEIDEKLGMVDKLSTEKVDQADLEDEVTNQLDGVKADIVAELIAQIGGMPVFGTVDDNKIITVTSTLADGTYTLMYENEDGTISEIGTITVGNGEVVTYTNLADPTSEYWKNDYRINSSLQYVEAVGMTTTNWFPCETGDIVRVKGLAMARQELSDGGIEVGGYSGFNMSTDGTTPFAGKKMSEEDIYPIISRDVNGIETLDLSNYTHPSGTYNYICLTGRVEGTVEGIIITVNEEIV